MIRLPKGLTLGANAKGEFRLLYVGDDLDKANEFFDRQPEGIAHLFLFKRGILSRSRETAATRLIRDAQLKEAERVSQLAHQKAIEDREAAKKKAQAAEKTTREKAQREAAAKEKKTLAARTAHEARVLQIAAKEASEAAHRAAAEVAGDKKSKTDEKETAGETD